MAVAHKKMDVLVRFVGMDCEHDLIAVKKPLGKLLRNVEHFFIGQLIIIIGRERQRHLERKVRPLVITLAEQLSCGENIARINVAVAVHLPAQVRSSFYDTCLLLFGQLAQHIPWSPVKLYLRFAGLVIYVDIPEHYFTSSAAVMRHLTDWL